ncbi:MAG: dihydrofolate reductase [Candidatus Izemoplasmatales bacterium]|mgnify:CR=1 FL=1|jgi:dihydrofolate reductase|nr:dihydrofolate reductase [Candidatus Izemoplasmatales bacterium]MDD4354638.1 dihydrofolate reductase [Candidatus Izemoplasmatales bacterium]MDD4987349.1 dihydrofolate reductase [Candidatus Izemoplasmatales bacterium]MDD5602247.1 dihydrofolate reductase [Candidatus Izemoplasmatales bacterium]MDY0373028.1 dihydrofolate reductase [Candidatus Izemoplasmatales bacterium]
MINLIFAMDPQGLIGKGNDLPWYYPEDLAYFKRTTLNKTVVMGLETFRSILSRNNKPLQNRKSVVASLEPFSYPGIEVTNDLITYLKEHRQQEIFVIGGKTIYDLSLPLADRLYITEIKKTHEGDVYLAIDLSDYSLVWQEDHADLTFAIYERKDAQ